MKIETIPVKGKIGVMAISIDGEEWREIHRAIFGRQPVWPRSLSLEEWEKAFELIEYQKARNYVLKRLGVQSYHSEELRKLLLTRLVSTRVTDRLINDFLTKGFLNDEAWLDSFFRIQSRRYGFPILIQKLAAKGLKREVLASLEAKYRNPEQEREEVKKLLLTKYRSKDLTQIKEKQKVVASLLRKGYSYEKIKKAISETVFNK